jgi:hypothetical protein
MVRQIVGTRLRMRNRRRIRNSQRKHEHQFVHWSPSI